MLYGLVIEAQTASETKVINSTNDPIVIDCRESTVIPYGNSKIVTFTDVEVSGEILILSYKLENKMTENPVLIANYTEGNIACATKSFHYVGPMIKPASDATTDNTFYLKPTPQSFVSGNVLVRIFFMDGQNTDSPIKAISNVVSVRMDF
jgi:hypothetical protein